MTYRRCPTGCYGESAPYDRSANLTSDDARDFLAIAARTPIKTEIVPYLLSDANTALRDLREGRLTGAAVLVPEH